MGRDMQGPYSADNGVDAYGHPVNPFGRCEQLNTAPDFQCPTASQQTDYLMGLPNNLVINVLIGMGFPIPEPHENADIVPTIIAAQFPTNP